VVGGWVAVGVVVVGVVGVLAFGVRGDGGDVARGGAPEATAVGGREYRGVEVDAGNGVVVEADPPQVTVEGGSGTFVFTPDGESFVAGAGLVALDRAAPGTLDGCRQAQAQGRVTAVARAQLAAGSRMCVSGADGATTLVTLRQVSAAHAVLDLTVWPGRQL
ncbi:hypothetical protein ACFPVZ_26395, partial [Actinacidiphila bryophytorum]